MPKKVRSAKGQVIDFDLLRIKQQFNEESVQPSSSTTGEITK